MKYGYRKGRFHKENASRLGKLGAEARRRKIQEGSPDQTPRRVPEGELLEILDLRSASGQMRRWIIRQGPRANNIIVEAKGKKVVCGWDHLMKSLRRHLSVPKRLFPDCPQG